MSDTANWGADPRAAAADRDSDGTDGCEKTSGCGEGGGEMGEFVGV